MKKLLLVIIPPWVGDSVTVLGLIVASGAVFGLIRKGWQEVSEGIVRRAKERVTLDWVDLNRKRLEHLIEEDEPPCRNNTLAQRDDK